MQLDSLLCELQDIEEIGVPKSPVKILITVNGINYQADIKQAEANFTYDFHSRKDADLVVLVAENVVMAE